MRRVAGAVLMLLGLCAALFGCALAVWLGTDNTATTGPHLIDTDAVAVATSDEAIEWTGATVRITAEIPDDKPVFVGVGNPVDVDDYLSQTRTLRVDRYSVPWTLKTSVQDGQQWLPATPVALDWWQTSAAGMGGASVEFELPEETMSLVILAVGDNDLSGLTVTAAYEVRGGFLIGLGLVGIGLGIIIVAVLLMRGFRRPTVVDEDGFIYVYIDEDGNERLVPIEELDEYDVVDVTGEKS